MSAFDTDQIKRAISLRDEMERRGVRVNRRGYALCPFHRERTPSLKVYPDGTFHCFGCGAHGDVISFVGMADGLSFYETCRKLTGEDTPSPGELRRSREERRAREESRADGTAVLLDRERAYHSAGDAFAAAQRRVRELRPKGPGDPPSPEWLDALSRLTPLRELLEDATYRYIKQIDAMDSAKSAPDTG